MYWVSGYTFGPRSPSRRRITAIHEANRRSRESYYTPERPQPSFKINGFEAGVWHIKQLRKKLGISYRQIRLWP